MGILFVKPMRTYVTTCLVTALLAAAATWRVQDWRYAEKEVARLQLEAEARKMREKAVSLASENHEKAKEKERVVYKVVTETIERIVGRPVYSNICMDEDGIMAINRGEVK